MRLFGEKPMATIRDAAQISDPHTCRTVVHLAQEIAKIEFMCRETAAAIPDIQAIRASLHFVKDEATGIRVRVDGSRQASHPSADHLKVIARCRAEAKYDGLDWQVYNGISTLFTNQFKFVDKPVPLYEFKSHLSILDTFLEYYDGIGSSVGVAALEETFGPQWRRGQERLGQERRRRAAVAGWVKRLIEAKGSREQAKRYIEERLAGISHRIFHDKYLATGKQQYPLDAQ